jgi:biopolymer transport protein ExbD
MKFKQRYAASCDPDMTPMIDITFQLVIFFMLTLNFAQVDQDERIKLPASQLAKPAESSFETPILLQLTDDNTVLIGGDEVMVGELRPLLDRERRAIQATKGRSLENATVIIRADRQAKTGKVQQVIQAAQDSGFERFVLRAKQEGG